MKILIFGKNGQVGTSLMLLLADSHELCGYDLEDFNLTQTDKIEKSIREMNPDWVINASAYTAVDQAESEADLADKINHLAPAVMAQICSELGCGFLHYSTDYVFDGTKAQAYVETDVTNPQSVYGKTKLAGEQAVLEAYPGTIILRTAWVYALQGKNFVNTMLKLADEREQISVVDDQVGSPTLANDLAKVSVSIIENCTLDSLLSVAGIYHVTGSGITSWYGFAKQIFVLANKSIELNAISSDEYPTPAPRPQYSVLNNQKLQQAFGITMPDWKESLAQTLAHSKFQPQSLANTKF